MLSARSVIFLTMLMATASLLRADVPADYQGKPYSKSPFAVPGTIKATEYDVAPGNVNGITFNYDSPPKSGPLRTTDDCIGMTRCGQGHVTTKGEVEDAEQSYLGWTQPGEWTRYTLHVSKAGTYIIAGHFAAALPGAKVSFAFGKTTTGSLDIPTTAGYQPGVEVYHVWERLDHLAEVKLPAGDVVMTMKIGDVAGINIESITLSEKQ